MKKQILGLFSVISLLSLTACNTYTSINRKEIVEISSEVEVTEITNSYLDVYNKVNKGCCGVLAKTNDQAGTGSAVIYKYKDGFYYAVTNAHVVKDKEEYAMYFGNNKYVKADLIGYDATNDVAVLKFSLDSNDNIDIEVIDFMNYEVNDLVTIGQSVVAIGCPLSLNNYNNIATGVIADVTPVKYTTDAQLNPGNSGGGSFNLAARFIGLNYKKETWTTSGGSQIPVEGRCYIIPYNVVKQCVLDIESKNGNVDRPLIGITVTTLNAYTAYTELLKSYLAYLPEGTNYGFMVTAFTEGVPYGKNAGLEKYDVILKVNDTILTSSDTLSEVLHLITLDDAITLTVYRKSDNQNHEIVVSFK